MGFGQFVRAALLCVGFLLSGQAVSADLIGAKAYFEDKSGKLSFAQVQQETFTPYEGLLTKGFTHSVYWLRLSLDPTRASSKPMPLAGGFPPAIHKPSSLGGRFSDTIVLRVRPPFLDQVELFDPLEPHKTNRVTGNVIPWSSDEFGSLNHGFLLPMGDTPRDVWLRVSATSTMVVGVDALPYQEMLALEKQQELLNLLDAALNVFFIVWAGLLFAMRPDRLVGAFLVVMVVSFFYATNYMGYYRIFFGDWFPAELPDIMQSVLVIVMLAAYMLFNRRLLQDYRPNPLLMRLLLPVQYYFVVGLSLLFAGFEQLALMLNILNALVGQLLVCLILIQGFKASERSENAASAPVLSRRWALVYSLLLTFLFGGLGLPALGLIEATQTSLYRSIIQGAVPFVFMAVIVHLRNRRLEREQQRQIAIAEQSAASEKSRREESEQFLAMLTHEIRTPLTVMAYASKTDLPEGQLGEHVKAGIEEIDGLIERCVQADRADQAGLALVMSETTLDAVLHTPRARFAGERVRWSTTGLPGDLAVSTDVTLFDAVLNNLIDNALKYSPPDQPVSVDVSLCKVGQRQGVNIVVSNKLGAAGFPDPDRVFDKYYRAPRAHIRTGSGLGLYVARSFATKLGGRLDYCPTADLVCFELWLPL